MCIIFIPIFHFKIYLYFRTSRCFGHEAGITAEMAYLGSLLDRICADDDSSS